MNFTDSQARLVRDCVTEMVLRRQRTGEPIPERVRGLLAYVSAHGRPCEPDSAPSDKGHDELIDTDQAAEILNCSTRHVRRIATDLDGRNVSGRWVFTRHCVAEYAQAKASTG